MESLCSSCVSTGGIEACLSRQPARSLTLVKAPIFRSRGSRGPGKAASLTLSCPAQRRGKRWPAVARQVSGGIGENDRAPVNGMNVLIDDAPPLIEDDSQNDGNGSCKREKMELVTPAIFENGKTGSKAGLFRTPILGGVQSATSVYNLPRPALAVRNLMEQAKFGQLCTIMSRMHHNRAGYPVGSLVDFVSDSMGHPIFSLSPLAIHTRNILVNSKCSLLVQIPGWSSLSNARVTIFGDVIPLAANEQLTTIADAKGSLCPPWVFIHMAPDKWAYQQFVAKHQQCPSQQWNNFYYFRMQNIRDIYFIGGFGTVAWIDVREYEALKPDNIAASSEQHLKELNALFSVPLKKVLSIEAEIDDAAFISIDSKGTDVRTRQGAEFNVQRIPFEVDNEVHTLEDAKAALERIIHRHNSSKLHDRI